MSKRPPADPATVFVIAHTHWDREWYATFQQFRLRLVHMLDALLDLLERDPSYTHFNLDAQTVVLEDYLEIRPEKRQQLQKFVAARRLGVGPWYVLPDEFLVSGEALVRNLMLGHRLAGAFGHVQKVGYIPDTFGHISQLPQILQGFDIPFAMHFRGLDEGRLKSELWWCSPDGSRVLLRHLPTDFGYASASALAEGAQAAAADLAAFARYETRRAASSVLLALNGVDHLPAREDLPAVLAAANQNYAGQFVFRQASLEDYFAALSLALEGRTLQTVTGELRDANRTPGRDNRLLPHILSSRMYLKQQNERAQDLLERWAEPWSALAWLEGEDYPAAFLWKAWEWLLQNHAHDSIGGCSIDPVHAQMETRFEWASEIAGEITRERFELFTRRIDLSGLKEDEAALVVFNSLPWPVEGGITVDLDLWDFFLQRVAMLHWSPAAPGEEVPPGAEAPDIFRRRVLQQWYGDPPVLPALGFRGLRLRLLEGGEPLPVQVETIDRSYVLRPLISGPASERRGVRVRASFAVQLPACGYRVFAVAPVENPNHPLTVALPHNVLENEFLRVQIAPNGTFHLEDKTTGQVFRDLGYFEDGGDCGDGYNYSYPLTDRVVNTLGCATRISRLAAGPAVQRWRIDYEWSLPEGLDGGRRQRSQTQVQCPLSVTLTLAQGAPRLDLEVRFDNRARDHRLRILFPCDIQTDVSQAGAQFDVVGHPVQVVPVPPSAWVEDAPTTFPQQDWVDLSDGERGLCVISRGLPEYELLDTPRREVAVTLLRAVGFLGAGTEMQTAAVGAGPNIATPEAQIQRTLTCSLALFPHRRRWDQAEVWRQALAFKDPPRAYMAGQDPLRAAPAGAKAPLSRSLLSVEGRNAVLSALKKAEDGQALILRLYNPAEVSSEAVIHLPFVPAGVHQTGLDEQPLADGQGAPGARLESGGRLQVVLPPKKIITLRLERSETRPPAPARG
jgi:mannosylglycerate hydrolase